MLSFIKGVIEDIEQDKLVIECNNIGYAISVPSNVINAAGKIGDNIKLYTHICIKEDSMTMFGFLSKDELNLFKQIITVSGIGPKGALSILSTLSADNLKIAIMSDDSKAIAKSPGIGAKTASKLILELKDKIDVSNLFSAGISSDNPSVNINDNITQGDAMDALMVLGYSSVQASNALKAVFKENPDITDAGELVKKALKHM